MKLRSYQERAVQGVRDEMVRGNRRVLLVIPTGGGKTVTASSIILNAVAKQKRCIFLAHRKELISQCSRTLDFLGVDHGVIKRGHPRLDTSKPVQVASIQTLIKRSHWDADLIVIDEAHRSCAKTYKDIVARYNEKTCILGLSGTPYRLDGKPLGEIYDALVEGPGAQELIDEGCLIDPSVFGAKSVDLSEVDVGARGDFKRKQVAAAMSSTILHGELLTNWARICGEALGSETIYYKDDEGRDRVSQTNCDACTVIFAPNVEKSLEIIDQFKAAGVRAAHLDGKTKPKERKQILEKLESGEISVVSNVDILCLDEETEILTKRGWMGIDSMKKSDEVANWWPDGSVTFSVPRDVIRRKRKKSERMVSVDGKHANFRVTENHRMLFRERGIKECIDPSFFVCEANRLVGKSHSFPLCGVSDPDIVSVYQEFDISEKDKRRIVARRSHHLRSKHGYDYEDSVREAKRRCDAKYSLRTKTPDQLTNDECWFIGFWIGDGSRCKLQSGGVEYTIGQSLRYSSIIKKLEKVIKSIGVDFVFRDIDVDKSKHKFRIYSFPRGTGSGCQHRRGLFPIEIYLKKDFARELWGLSRDQLWSLISGLWCADGRHGVECDPGEYALITNTNYEMISMLQAVSVCRGMKASLSKPLRNGKNATRPIYNVGISKNKKEHRLVSNLPVLENVWRDEMVWCCNVESSFIITRRMGKVMVTGNCEGWDLPRLECVLGARPTRSKSLYKQMGGRLMRPNDDARIKFLLDHANWTRMHGFLSEPTTHSLDKPEKRPRKKKGDNGRPLKECPQCEEVCPLGTQICNGCGYEWPKKEYEFTDENLVQLDAEMVGRADVVPQDERQEAFEKLASACVEKGYKPNWARVRYQSAYGEWPSKDTGIMMPAFFRRYERDLNKKRNSQMIAQAAADAATG